ncbi:MAG: type II secretion system protein GspL [Thiobacillaceae bacterium]
MSELRLYLRRDTFSDGNGCAWALLDDKGHVQSTGNQLDDLPRSRRCRLVLAAELVLTLDARLPDLPERRLAPLLPAAVEAATLVDADAIHAVIMDRPSDGLATLAVLDESWFKRTLSKLAEFGLHPDSALPEYLLLPWTANGWSVCWRSNNSMARFGKCEGMSLDEGEPPAGLILALAQRGRPDAVHVYASENAGAPDWSRWRTTLGTPVEAAGPWDALTAPWPELPSLMQGTYTPGLRRLDWVRLTQPLIWGGVALLAIQLVGVTLDWAMLSRENANILHEMHGLAEQALPVNSAIVDPPWQVMERLQSMQAASGNPAPNALVGLLGRLSMAWPALGTVQVRTLSYEGGGLSASIAGADPSWLDQLKTAAATQGLSVSSTVDQDNANSVRLTIRPTAKEGIHG